MFRTITLSVSLLAMLSACIFKNNGCIKVKLSKEEISWFAHYKDGDTVYFKTEIGEVDTFVVSASTLPEYSPCNRFELDPYIYASMGVSFHSLDNYNISKTNRSFWFAFDKTGQDTNDVNSNKVLEFFELEVNEFQDFSKFPQFEYYLPKEMKCVKSYVFTKGFNCSNVSGQGPVLEEFAITKKYGLVWYRTVKGETYERVWD